MTGTKRGRDEGEADDQGDDEVVEGDYGEFEENGDIVKKKAKTAPDAEAA